MAEEPTPLKSPAEIDKEAITRYNRLLKESIERDERFFRHNDWRGGKFPPFSIEPMPHERNRLATPMSAEDRALRKQWVFDQRLSPNEPRYIPDLYPKNPIRRLLAAPWDFLFNTLKPVLGEKYATSGRYLAPRAVITAFIVWGAFYNLKYHPADWTSQSGWHIYHSRLPAYPGDENYPTPKERKADDFNDRGFKKREALREIRTGYSE